MRLAPWVAAWMMVASAIGLIPALALEEESVRVGVYENAPLILTRPDGSRAGLAIDILEAVAGLEGWQLDYRSCEFSVCLERLRQGDLDLIPAVAYSDERSLRNSFSEVTLMSNFGQILAGRGVALESFLDLDGRRIAVMRDNIHSDVLSDLVRRFDLSAELVPTGSFEEVVQMVERGDAEAGVVGRLFRRPEGQNGNSSQARPTGIVFNPVEVRFAAPLAEGRALLAAIDRHLRSFKETPDSIYYQSLAAWMPPATDRRIPTWVNWTGGTTVALLLLALVANRVLHDRVRARTEELYREVRERRAAQEDLYRASFYDSLTGFPNRLLLRDRLRQALAEARQGEREVAVIFINLDSFRVINEAHGLSAGDELLGRVAERLRAALREADTLARLGADEFVVVLTETDDPALVHRVAGALLERQRAPLELGGRNLVITASMGSASFPRDARDAESLLRCAEVAMTGVKKKGCDGYLAYSAEMAEAVEERLDRELLLRRAIADERLVVHYQPIVGLDLGLPVAVEALLRIPRPGGELLLPDAFIPLAEDVGLINRLGSVVLKQACTDAMRLPEAMRSGLRLMVNISPRQLEDPDFLETVDLALASSGFPATALEFEVTEGLFLDSVATRGRLLSGLRQKGIRLSIDDFGTGYSSLSYLNRLPISTLKIDQVFVQEMTRNRGSAEIVAAIIGMARGLGVDVVAEGIETGGQMEGLRRMGCPLGQGYFIAKPMPLEDLEDWLRESDHDGAVRAS